MNVIRTARPGVCVVESRSTPGTYHTLINVGTPFVSCDCPAGSQGRPCSHIGDALKESEEHMPDESRALTLAQESPVVVRAAEMQLRVASHLTSWNTFKALGEGMLASGLLPNSIKQPEQAALVLMKAYSLGIEPSEAFDYIDVINGRPNLRAQMVRALVARSGRGRIQVVESTATRCVAIGYREGWAPTRVEYTIDDAQRADLLKNPNYQKFPADMLVARATSRVGRRLFADVLSGMDVAEYGEPIDTVDAPLVGGTETVIDVEAREVPPDPAPAAAPSTKGYAWEAALREELAVASLDVKDMSRLFDAPATYQKIDEWLRAEDGRTVHSLVSAAADALAARQ